MATGSGDFYDDVNISAQSGPSGENPTGRASFTVPLVPVFASGAVTCLSVNGSTATLQFVDESLLVVVTVQLTDNGPPDAGLDTIDTATLAGRNPADCSTPPPGPGHLVSTLTAGTDAPPLPTSQEQCKNGGWAQYGFKTQGQCVAFVQRGPQP